MSAPVAVLAATAAISTDDGASLSLDRPSFAVAGDRIYAVLMWPDGLTEPDFEAAGWTVVIVGACHGEFVWMWREVVETEADVYDFAFTGTATPGYQATMGTLIAVRGSIDGTLPFGVTEVTSHGPVFANTTVRVTLESYLDAEISVYAANDPDGFDDTSQTIAAANGSDGAFDGSIAVVFNRPEAAGVAPIRLVTLTSGGTNADGNIGSFGILGDSPAVAASLTPLDPPGAIGLPWVGA